MILSQRATRRLESRFESCVVLRVYVGDDGLFIALESDEPIEPIVDAVEETAPRPRNQNS